MEGWRLIATRDAIELTPAGQACQAGPAVPVKTFNGQGTAPRKFVAACNSKQPHPGSLRGLGDWFDSYYPHEPSSQLRRPPKRALPRRGA